MNGAPITKAEVEHWTKVISRGGLETGLLAQSRGAPRQRALEFLIACDWLTDEAGGRGLAVRSEAIDRQLEEQRDANGSSEFQRSLDSTGKTLADVKLEIKAAVAAAKLRGMLSANAANVSESQIVDFYQANTAQFRLLPRREVDLIENIKTRSAALAIRHRVGSGARFTHSGFHESIQRGYEFGGTADGRALEEAIFHSPIGVARGPMKVHQFYILFIVRQVIPPSIEPLRRVRQTVIKQLTAQRYQAAVDEFLSGLRGEWVAKTHCEPGYVVQKCAQYRGSGVAEGNLLGDA